VLTTPNQVLDFFESNMKWFHEFHQSLFNHEHSK
jgi:hypothetical protein